MRKNMGSNRLQPRLRKAVIAMASSAAILAFTAAAAQSPVDLANPLVGTAPLDDPAVIGNAPPPGEPVYSGQTSPGEIGRASCRERVCGTGRLRGSAYP